MKKYNAIEDFKIKLYMLLLLNGIKAALFSKLWFWIQDWLILQNTKAIGVCFRRNEILDVPVSSDSNLNVCRILHPSFFI